MSVRRGTFSGADDVIAVGGSAEPHRGALNLIAGVGVSIAAADNAGADRTDVTISATVDGGSP